MSRPSLFIHQPTQVIPYLCPSDSGHSLLDMKRIQIITLVTALMGLTLGKAVAQPTETGKEILAKAIKATGGKFGGIRGPVLWMTRGIQHQNGSAEPFVAQFATQWPDWFRREVEGKETTTVSRSDTWLTTADGVSILSGRARTEMLHQVRIFWATRLFPLQDESQYQLEAIPGVTVESRTTVGLRITHTDGHQFRFYFDADSYLLSKLTAKLQRQGVSKEETMEAYFSAHRSFAGARMPTKVTVFHNGKLTTESEVVATKSGATLDPDFFKLPQ
jgi:hypothetical protein